MIILAPSFLIRLKESPISLKVPPVTNVSLEFIISNILVPPERYVVASMVLAVKESIPSTLPLKLINPVRRNIAVSPLQLFIRLVYKVVHALNVGDVPVNLKGSIINVLFTFEFVLLQLILYY